MHEIQDYLTNDGKDPFKDWVSKLADRVARLKYWQECSAWRQRLGDCKPLDEGVWELRIDHGPGYRVYYARAGNRLILLLIGGDKRRQQSDIDVAVTYWNDWQRRHK